MSELLKPETNVSHTDGTGKRLDAITAGLSSTSKTMGLLVVALFWILGHYTIEALDVPNNLMDMPDHLLYHPVLSCFPCFTVCSFFVATSVTWCEYVVYKKTNKTSRHTFCSQYPNPSLT
jgi:hypothetical protein